MEEEIDYYNRYFEELRIKRNTEDLIDAFQHMTLREFFDYLEDQYDDDDNYKYDRKDKGIIAIFAAMKGSHGGDELEF